MGPCGRRASPGRPRQRAGHDDRCTSGDPAHPVLARWRSDPVRDLGRLTARGGAVHGSLEHGCGWFAPAASCPRHRARRLATTAGQRLTGTARRRLPARYRHHAAKPGRPRPSASRTVRHVGVAAAFVCSCQISGPTSAWKLTQPLEPGNPHAGTRPPSSAFASATIRRLRWGYLRM